MEFPTPHTQQGGKMTDNHTDNVKGVPAAPFSTGLAGRIGLFVLFLACSLLIFLLGANYYKMFPTNGNRIYAACVAAVFLVAALLFKSSSRLHPYWQVFYAFFVASMVNLISDLFAGYNGRILQWLGIASGTNAEYGIAKVYDALLVIIPILVLSKLAGADLGGLFIKKGNHHWKWGVGIGSLLVINYLTSVLIFFGTGYRLDRLGPAILWGLVFAFSNSFMEELWVRGLFLKKLVPLIGSAGAIILTSAWFASLHFLSLAYLPAAVVPIFVINTFTLGLACGILTLKTDSLWGAVLVHAAADLFLFIATLAAH
jgi:membrane protease YdiL (CAAX protease family)